MNAQWTNHISGKELLYISDSLKNEELIAKMCMQGAVEGQNQQLKQLFSQMAQERLHNFEQLYRTLQQTAHVTQ
jgi:hypothetical protein